MDGKEPDNQEFPECAGRRARGQCDLFCAHAASAASDAPLAVQGRLGTSRRFCNLHNHFCWSKNHPQLVRSAAIEVALEIVTLLNNVNKGPAGKPISASIVVNSSIVETGLALSASVQSSKKDSMLKPRVPIQNLHPYHSPIGSRAGLALDLNENASGCSPRVLARLRALTAEEVSRYPKREIGEQLVGKFLGITPEQVLLSNGMDDALAQMFAAYLSSARRAGRGRRTTLCRSDIRHVSDVGAGMWGKGRAVAIW